MNNGNSPPPLITGCKMWQRTSASGTVYWTGRLGGLRVLLMPNRDRTGDDDASHNLLFGEAAAREAPRAAPDHERRSAPRRTQPGGTIEDDRMPF